jgi:hypothetical protein
MISSRILPAPSFFLLTVLYSRRRRKAREKSLDFFKVLLYDKNRTTDICGAAAVSGQR